MKFSIIMASYLGDYPSAASNREGKILRAIRSVFNQTYQDFELIVVADGCDKTVETVSDIKDERIRLFEIERTGLFSGAPRNTGIKEAKGDWIAYLDIDDVYGSEHLQMIESHLEGDWVWFNDLRYLERLGIWVDNHCEIKLGGVGTSNICHRRGLDVAWPAGYAHDYHFIKDLQKYNNYKKIPTPQYLVCHIPGGVTIRGYNRGYDI